MEPRGACRETAPRGWRLLQPRTSPLPLPVITELTGSI